MYIYILRALLGAIFVSGSVSGDFSVHGLLSQQPSAKHQARISTEQWSKPLADIPWNEILVG